MPTVCRLDLMGQATTNRRIVFAAQGKRIEFVNARERTVRQIELDRETLPSDFGPRCDGVLVGDESMARHEHYVELKGSNVRHALEQLENTLQRLSRDLTHQRKSCYAICSRVPRVGTDVQIAQRRFRTRYAARLSLRTLELLVNLK